MKKLFSILFSVICLSMMTAYADGLNSAQLKLRNEIKTFLQEEGFMPEIDSDGDVGFKREGDKYYVIVSDNDDSPMYVTLSKYFSYGERYNRQTISQNLERANRIKGVKILCGEKNYVLQAEMYLVSSESFKYVFYKLLSQLDALEERVDEICADGGSGYGSNSGYGSSGYGTSGGMIVNEQFNSHSSAWKKTKGTLLFNNGKMSLKDMDDSGYSILTYDLPRNLSYEDFEIEFSMKITFASNSYSCLQFLIGEDWLESYVMGFGLDSGLIDISFGDKDSGRAYFGYSTDAKLSPSLTHRYTMKKRGRNVQWYADGKLLFSVNIDLSKADMNLIGFRVSDFNKIELDYLTIKPLN